MCKGVRSENVDFYFILFRFVIFYDKKGGRIAAYYDRENEILISRF